MSFSCYLLFFFLTVQGSMAFGLDNCDTLKCLQDSELRSELESIGWAPTTEEQLIRLCPSTLTTMRCLIEAIEECAEKNITELSTSDIKELSNFAHSLVTIRYYITELCTPGSEFRENYLSSISCVKGLATDQQTGLACQQRGRRWYAAYERASVLMGWEVAVEDKENEGECFVMAYTMACFATEINYRCSEVARKTFVDSLKRFQYLKREECTEANFNRLKIDFLNFLDYPEWKKNIFSTVFETRRK